MSDQPQAGPTPTPAPSPSTDNAAGPDTAATPPPSTAAAPPPTTAAPPPTTTPPTTTAAPPPGTTSETTRPRKTEERDTASVKLTRLAARGIGKAVKTARDTIDATRGNDTVSRTLDGVKEQVAENPRTAEKIARRAAFTAMSAAAAASPAPIGKMQLKRATPIVVNQVGKAVKRIAKQSTEEEPGQTSPAKLAERLAARPRPNPAELYRDGTDTLELRHPLPQELASIPWKPLGRKDRFCLLVAAWAYREADGVESLKEDQFGQATAIFQECLVRAEYLRTPELMVRSYEDLAHVATAKGDEKAARSLRLAAAQTKDDAGMKPEDEAKADSPARQTDAGTRADDPAASSRPDPMT
ncbi:MAG TPA: hypothetical protein VGI74_18990 [Streptosporangiaceae bacterium]|jgi:hypothetical protein